MLKGSARTKTTLVPDESFVRASAGRSSCRYWMGLEERITDPACAGVRHLRRTSAYGQWRGRFLRVRSSRDCLSLRWNQGVTRSLDLPDCSTRPLRGWNDSSGMPFMQTTTCARPEFRSPRWTTNAGRVLAVRRFEFGKRTRTMSPRL